MSDDANDVTKALAAFGAPSIRYHSFGQAQVRPSSVILPRRVVLPGEAVEPVTRQEEPVAAPEQAPLTTAFHSPVPAPALHPRPAPALRQAEPMRAPLPTLTPPVPTPPAMFTSTPTVAPPPRPLAEWAAPAAPVSTQAPRPVMPPSPNLPPPMLRTPVPTPGPTPTPPVQAAPVSQAAPTPRMSAFPAAPIIQPRDAAPQPAAASSMARNTNHGTVSKSPKLGSNRTLQDIFEFLASGPAPVGAASS